MTLAPKLAEVAFDATPSRRAPITAQRRWQILHRQLRAGHEPCFGTERRHTCPERKTCEFRAECLSMRAAWRR